jgi:hypothetical protein
MDGRLEIFTTGGVHILRRGEPLADLGYCQAEALCIYFLVSTRRLRPDEVLADLLSEELAQSQALVYLRVVLTVLVMGIQTSTGRVSLIFLNSK